MTQSKNTKRALTASVLSLVLCFTMLIGSTFAWFTDTATTGVNKITAGNLDVELKYSTTMNGTDWKDAQDATNIFESVLWEPGHTQVVYFKVVNAGSLAFDYEIATNIVLETAGTNQEGDTFKLSDYLQFGIVECTAAYTDRAAARDAIEIVNNFGNVSPGESTLEKGDSAIFAMVVWMPEDTGNVANHNGKNIPEIQFGVNVIARQANVEKDSFDENYDKDSKYSEAPKLDAIVAQAGNAESLATLLDSAFKNGGEEDITITLTQNIAIGEEGWTTFAVPNTGKDIVIDGAGYTISGLDKPLITGLWGGSGSLTFKNLTIDAAKIEGYDSEDVSGSMSTAGAFMAYSDHANAIVFDNCKLTNSTVSSSADYVGGLVGYSSASNTTFTNCSVTNCTISGYKSTGAIIGHIGGNVTISEVISSGNIITGNTAGREWGVGAIFGRSNSGTTVTMTAITISNNTITQENATNAKTSEYYGAKSGTVTLDGNAI